jgi:hypothetical protein
VDAIPLQVETVFQLEVSGKAREVLIAGAVLPGAFPIAVQGELPARVDGSSLRVQVRAGRHRVSVLARLDGRGERIAAPAALAAAVDRAVWVFQSNETLRQVEPAGLDSVDPSRTDLPEDWRSLPAFLASAGDALTLKEVRRGQPEAPPDALQLRRELWLDVDGGAFTVRDTITGAAHRTTRLDLLAPAELGRAAIDGQDQLVTKNPRTGAPGVELRKVALQVVADGRLPRRGTTPAVGWSANVEQLAAELRLPPGWSLLAASGVDRADGAWTARWDLLGFFFVLIVGLAVSRLFGRAAGALALAAMVSSYGEADAPQFAWLVVVAAIALRRVATEGWLGRIGRVGFLVSVGVLAILLAGFAAQQVRQALYPQVAPPPAVSGGADILMHQRSAPAAVAQEAVDELKSLGYVASNAPGRQDKLKEEGGARSKVLSLNKALEQDPHAVLQTGPGVPTWQWRSESLFWNGPVSHEQPMHLWLLSPNANRVLTVVRLALLGLLGATLLGWRPRRPAPRADATPVVAAALVAFLAASNVSGQEGPSNERLEELKARLTRPPACAPHCVTTADLTLRVRGEQIVVEAEVHAQADASWPAPGPTKSWMPSRISVDGAPWPAVVRSEDGFLHLRLRAGVHRVEIAGAAPADDSVTLELPEPPRRSRADAPDWEVVGLREQGTADGSIQLTRRLVHAGGAHAEGVYPPWLEVERAIEAGVSWRATTRVRRASPSGSPVAVRVPLLPGESLTEGGHEVENGEVLVSLAADEDETGWSSTLQSARELTLTAPAGRPWSEVWRLQCGVVWQCAAQGLVPVVREREGVQEPEYRPWPGESLQLTFEHPAGVSGQTMTLDDVQLETTPGSRLEKSKLTISARASRDEVLALALPAEADLQTVTLDGHSRPVRADAGKVRLTVPVGAHVVVLEWQQPRSMGLHHALPVVDLGRPAVNVTQALNVPPDRWLLFVHGPAWGPAILFWGYLLVVLVVAWGLSRVPFSPLRTREWVLLALGLTQVESVFALIVAGFFLALAWRCRRPPASAALHNLLQLGLVVWALVALASLYGAIHTGLLLSPDMEVAGNGSTGSTLRWFADRVASVLPGAGVISLPIWVYRLAMLAWALWLALSLVRWTVWAWGCFNEGGLWRAFEPRSPKPSEPGPVVEVPPSGPEEAAASLD